MNRRITFKDPELQAAFEKTGFLKFPFLDARRIGEIKKQLLALSPSDNYQGFQETALGKAQSFHTTFFDSSDVYRKGMWDLMESVFAEFTDQFLDHHRIAQANVFLKPPGQGFLHPHQNLAILDESQYTSVSLWCPLQDVNAENGTLFFIPGSQDHFLRFRSTHVFWPYIPFFGTPEGLKWLQPLEMKAGELVILDDRIVHATPTNKSDSARWAIHALYVPEEAQLFYPEVDPEKVDLFPVSRDFYQYYRPGTHPQGLTDPITVPNTDSVMEQGELLHLLDRLKRNQE